MEIYIATAYRLGSRENHSYVIGAYSSLYKAKIAAREELSSRGNKYGYGIDVCNLDSEVKCDEENIIGPFSQSEWDADDPDKT